MKISVLAPNLSHNSLGRAYLLAKLLQRRYEVEIIGPTFNNKLWPPLANEKGITIKPININFKNKLNFIKYFKIISNIIEGDIIYASKPYITSFGTGILLKSLKKKPLILDIDDWELGIFKENFKGISLYFRSLGYWQFSILEKLSFIANEITVSNTFLQKKFGGTVIWHTRDPNLFNPKKYNIKKIRKKYNVDENKKIIMFFGTPKPYKGIDDLIEAMCLIKDPDIILCIVGINESDKYCKNIINKAISKLKNRFIYYGFQPFNKVPEILTMADIIVVPQRKCTATIGQIPAKIFDAMALGKPIIATDVSDLGKILKNCGIIIEPSNPQMLAKKIVELINDPKYMTKLGEASRKRFLEKYSWEIVSSNLIKLFEKYEHQFKQ